MSDGSEVRWKIDAFTATTMPLDRLAEYLRHLATVLGDPKHLHLLRVEDGSTVPVLRVDNAALETVRRRGADIRTGMASIETMEAYRTINRMLREDKTKATLFEGTAAIIPFPGKEEVAPDVPGIRQQGTLDGQLQKVGGAREWVPIQLRTMDQTTLSGCYAKRELAKQMGNHLFEPVRLYGRGRWIRTSDGQWIIDKFWVDTFDTLSDDPLPAVLASLRSVKANWSEDPLGDIRRDENE